MNTPAPWLSALLLWGCTASDKPLDPHPLDSLPLDSADSAPADSAPIESPLPFALPEGITNLVIIHADTLRADRLSLYGHDADTTPKMTARGHRAIRGLQSSAPWTLPSTASLLTGLEPHQHGLFAPNSTPGDQLDPAITTMAEIASNAGMYTMLYSGNSWVSDQTQLSRGFDQRILFGKRYPDNNLSQLVDSALEHITTQLQASERPFLLVLQPMNMHDPYFSPEEVRGQIVDPDTLPFDPSSDHATQETAIAAAFAADPEDTRAAVRAAYDEQLLGLDLGVDRLLTGLAQRGLSESTLVVLSADHGETLGDADLPVFGHGTLLRPELLNVPLVLFHPNLPAGASSRPADCPMMAVDTLPTLLSALDPAALPNLRPTLLSRLSDPTFAGRDLHDGCRDQTRSSLKNQNALDVGLATPDYLLFHACTSGITTAYDRLTDPTGEHPIVASTLPAWPDLRDDLSTWLSDLSAARPDLRCPAL